MNKHPGFLRMLFVLLLAAMAIAMEACDDGHAPATKADEARQEPGHDTEDRGSRGAGNPAAEEAINPASREASREASDGAGKETIRGGTIVAVGDSLTAGYGVSEKEAYPARLEQLLLSEGLHYKVVNAGISGETSSGTLSRIRWVLTLRPDIVILETGANDAFRGIPTKLVESNINEAVRILKEHNVIVVIAGMQIVGNLGQDYANAFKELYPRVAENQGVILIPFFLEAVAGEPGLNQPDAIHPTSQGYEIVTKTVYPYVVEAMKKHGRE